MTNVTDAFIFWTSRPTPDLATLISRPGTSRDVIYKYIGLVSSGNVLFLSLILRAMTLYIWQHRLLVVKILNLILTLVLEVLVAHVLVHGWQVLPWELVFQNFIMCYRPSIEFKNSASFARNCQLNRRGHVIKGGQRRSAHSIVSIFLKILSTKLEITVLLLYIAR
jgi:hypothetical protein